MNFKVIREVNAPASKVWEALWGQYHNVCDWASTVNVSGARAKNENPKNGRTCTSTWGEISEIVDTVNEKEMTFSYYADGLPSIMKSAQSAWTVTPTSTHTCEVVMAGEIVFAPIPGFLMGWMMKPKMRKDLHQTLDDFKYFIETGKQTAVKIKSDQKFNKKNHFKAA